MKKPAFYAFILILAFMSTCSAREIAENQDIQKEHTPGEWRVLDFRFHEEKQNLTWRARIARTNAEPSSPEFEVRLSYNSSLKSPSFHFQNAEKLAEYDFLLEGKKKINLPLIEKSYGWKRINVPAKTKDSLAFYPVFKLRTLTPFSTYADIQEEPLPSYAYVKMMREDFSSSKTGENTKNPGEFKIGPFKVYDLRKLKLQAILPLFPPGIEPDCRTEIYFRFGRPVEAYLDKGQTPPIPPLPENMTQDKVIIEVVRHVNISINPDTGEIRGLYDNELLDLYACAFDIIKNYPALQHIMDKKIQDKWGAKRYAFPALEEIK